ncbi:serine carboxypeptidase S28-domain-containing protein [Hyaloraphidium curvatum]|nr:serine carboxypeptidase S28-domain-containing protein [Hyaloraphidium curvatum]
MARLLVLFLVLCAFCALCQGARPPRRFPHATAQNLRSLPERGRGLHPPRRFPRPTAEHFRTLANQTQGLYSYETRFFLNTKDHFSFDKDSYATWSQRYLINDTYFNRERGPVFFYTGNEGAIDWFAANTGFMWELAKQQKALIVFAEHRFYGQSFPSAGDLSLLSAEQALADFAELLLSLKSNMSIADHPVIAFGGSYGGMLAAWMRIKYPHVITGAVASSAPVRWFGDLVEVDSFDRIVTDNFRAASQSCVDAINASWAAIEEVAAARGGLAELGRTFRACDVSSAEAVMGWLSSAYASAAMVNYPMPTSFLAPLPAFPIAHMCKAVDATNGTLLEKIAAGAEVFYNYSGQVDHCFDLGADPNGEDNWGFQYCTEMFMPMASFASTSMFPPADWNATETALECQRSYGVTPRPSWVLTNFGLGHDVSAYLKHTGSNIVFSAGTLDPWTAGCVLQQPNSRMPVILIDGGAHHLDLRAAHPQDPPSVIEARKAEATYVAAWVEDAWKHQEKSKGHEKMGGFAFGMMACVFAVALLGGTGMLLMASRSKDRVYLD